METHFYLGETLYIPLRSDKTVFSLTDKKIITVLYIPLRSDKTLSVSIAKALQENFISHYVQIKHSCMNFTFIFIASFISHYVQIKQDDTALAQIKHIYFISHYVQIKPHVTVCLLVYIRLYIPLRSDKTESNDGKSSS